MLTILEIIGALLFSGMIYIGAICWVASENEKKGCSRKVNSTTKKEFSHDASIKF